MRFIILITLVLSFPVEGNAFDGLVTCQEAGSCSFCSLMEMINTLIHWFIMMATLAVTLIMVYAGFLLIFSAGNAGALQKGKQLLIQSIIGILIMLAGWTIVDTFIKIFTGGNLGVWNEVQCGAGEFSVGDPTYNIDLDEHTVDVDTILTITTGQHIGRDVGSVDISACDTSAMESMNFLGHGVQVHRNLVGSLKEIDSVWRRHKGTNSSYAIRSVGGYNCRHIKGSSRRSYHSYGLAVDINPVPNPHCPSNPVCGGKNILITDMPDWLIQAFREKGWGWGGNWKSSKDAMHFSKAKGEGGDGRY